MLYEIIALKCEKLYLLLIKSSTSTRQQKHWQDSENNFNYLNLSTIFFKVSIPQMNSKNPSRSTVFITLRAKAFSAPFALFICSHCWHGLTQVIFSRWNSHKYKTRRKVNFKIWRETQQIEKALITIKSLWSMRLKN